MLRHLFASAAALALITGVAFAQDQQTTTREKTTVQGADGSQSVQGEKTEHTTDADGNQTMAKKSYNKTNNAGGSEMSRSHEEHTSSPDSGTSTSRETTTTKTPD